VDARRRLHAAAGDFFRDTRSQVGQRSHPISLARIAQYLSCAAKSS
jgi:hypothetical protein